MTKTSKTIGTDRSDQKATAPFNISRSSLRDKAHHCETKHPVPVEPPSTQSTMRTCTRKRLVDEQLENALKLIQKGMRISTASAKFNIPYNRILKNAKSRGIKRPKCSSLTIINGSKNWTPEQMTIALKAVHGGMTYTSAAVAYNIPMATLWKYAQRFGVRKKLTLSDRIMKAEN